MAAFDDLFVSWPKIWGDPIGLPALDGLDRELFDTTGGDHVGRCADGAAEGT